MRFHDRCRACFGTGFALPDPRHNRKARTLPLRCEVCGGTGHVRPNPDAQPVALSAGPPETHEHDHQAA